MCHYPKMIIQNGPLRYFSTLCHERSMSKYKATIQSKLNPTIQIANAMRFQMFIFSSRYDFLPIWSGRVLNEKDWPFSNIEVPNNAVVYKIFKFENMILSSGLAVYTDSPSTTWLSSSSPPTFAKIILVLSIDNTIHLIVRNLTVNTFAREFMCYDVSETSDLIIIKVNELYIKKTFSIHEFNSRAYLFPDCLPYKEF